MEQYLDSITDAYHGKLGQRMAQKTRERVHWIIKNSLGKNILDIGCSQGLVSILLAREGKSVTGIDIAKSSIDFAMESLAEEQEKVRELTRFIHGNFLYEELPANHFDTIIITEVLEHFITSREIVKRINSLLVDEGQIIITVPFGINDYPDHKRTLYLMEIYQEMLPYFKVEQVEFMGKWIGFIGTKGNGHTQTVPDNLFIETEKAFYLVERELSDKNSRLKEQVENYKNQLEEGKRKEEILLSKVAEYKEKNETLLKKIGSLEEQLLNQQQTNERLVLEHKEKESKQQELNERVKKQLDESKTIIKGLQSDSTRMEEKIVIMIKNSAEERDRYETTVKQLKNTNMVVKKQLEEKDLKLSEMEDQKNIQQEEIKELKGLCEQSQEEVTQLKQDIEFIKTQSNQQLEEDKKKIEVLVSETQSLQQEKVRVMQQLEEDKQRIEVLESETQSLQQEIEFVKTQSSRQTEEDKQRIEVLVSETQSLQEEIELVKTQSNQQLEEAIQMMEMLESETQSLQQEIDFTKAQSNQQLEEDKQRIEMLVGDIELIQQEIESIKQQSNQQLEVEKETIKTLLEKSHSLQDVIKKLQIEKEEILNEHLRELNELEEQLSTEMVNGQQTIEELKEKVTVLEGSLEQEKENGSLVVRENGELIQTLHAQIRQLKGKLQAVERTQKKETLHLKESLSNLLEESEEITKKLIIEMKEKELLQRKYQSLKNSKLGKITLKYWAMRSK